MNTAVKDYDYISAADPALDRDHPDYAEARRLYEDGIMTGGGASGPALPIKPGQEPVIWKLRHVAGPAREYIRGAYTDRYPNEVMAMALQYGVREVRNAARDGQPFDLEFGNCARTGVRMLTAGCVDAIEERFGIDVKYDVGGVIMNSALRVRPLS